MMAVTTGIAGIAAAAVVILIGVDRRRCAGQRRCQR